MILKEDILFVWIGGIMMRPGTSGVRPEYVLDPDAISGWHDGPSVKRVTTVRPNVWGDFAEPGLRNSRLITLTGSAISNTPEQLHKMRDDFMKILSDGGYAELAVQNASGMRYANVTLEGQPKWTQKLDNYAAYMLTLYAPDPRIFGEEKQLQIGGAPVFGGGMKLPITYPMDFHSKEGPRVIITNYGNVDSWPKFVVNGEYPHGFVINDNKDRRVVYRGVVTTAAPVTIDMAAGTAMQSGVDKSVNISVRDYFSIPARNSIRPSFEPISSGSGWCDIIWRDTWI